MAHLPEGEPNHPTPATTGAPRWVKVTLVVVGVLAVALVLLKVAGVDHGPGRHGGRHTSPSSQPTSSGLGGRTADSGAGAVR